MHQQDPLLPGVAASEFSAHTIHYHQVVIVGASIAGCCTALHLARKGINVAVIEKQPNTTTYKKMCSHLIHPAGARQLAKLGLLEPLVAMGGQATYLEVVNEGRRLYYPINKALSANNIERRYIDPMLKELMARQPNITTYYGLRASRLQHEKRQVTGLSAQSQTGELIEFRSPLVIAADGRKSRVAKLDKCKDKIVENHRVALFSYFKANSKIAASKVWALQNGDSYIACFPNGEKLLLSCYLPDSQFTEISENPREYYCATVKKFVEQQGIDVGEQLDELFIAKDTSTLHRTPRSKGLAFVGDAFLAADPLTGIGCSWAMSSAALLSACLHKQLPAGIQPNTPIIGWKRFKLNAAISLYQGLHRFRFLLPAYAMAWLSLKGKWVFNDSVFGTLAKILGDKNLHPEKSVQGDNLAPANEGK